MRERPGRRGSLLDRNGSRSGWRNGRHCRSPILMRKDSSYTPDWSVRSTIPLRAPALALFDGRREASEALERVEGQIGPQRVRSSIGLRTHAGSGLSLRPPCAAGRQPRIPREGGLCELRTAAPSVAESRARTSACRIRPMPTQRFAVSRGLPPLRRPPALGNGRILKCAAGRGQPDRGSAPTRRGRSKPWRAARPRARRARPRSARSRSPRTARRSFARAAAAPRGRRAALAPYGVPAPAARIRPAFRQRPRDGGDVPIRAGARVPGRSTPSRS